MNAQQQDALVIVLLMLIFGPIVLGLLPYVLRLLGMFLGAFFRGHLQESGLGALVGQGGSGSRGSGPNYRPYVNIEDPTVIMHGLRRRNGLWEMTTSRRGSGYRETTSLGGGRHYVSGNTLGSRFTVEWSEE